jgi:hypothetical protein
MIGGVRVHGSIRDVSVADLHAAIEADRTAKPGQIYGIEVLSSDEIWIYHEPLSATHPSRDIMKRVHGKWRYFGTPVILG